MTPEFKDEVLRLIQIKDPKVKSLEDDTVLSDNLDSLACVELIQAVEDESDIELSFEDIRECTTWRELEDLLIVRADA